jgi:phosphatidylglycerol:prolipoprotein diacylglycerol transferase
LSEPHSTARDLSEAFLLWARRSALPLPGGERFVIELFRAKDDRFLGPFTIAQTISIGLILAGLTGSACLSFGARSPGASCTQLTLGQADGHVHW